MYTGAHSALALVLLFRTACAAPLADVDKRQSGIYVPFYDTSANGHNSSARGWNTFGLQANPATWSAAGFDFNDFQCARSVAVAGSTDRTRPASRSSATTLSRALVASTIAASTQAGAPTAATSLGASSQSRACSHGSRPC